MKKLFVLLIVLIATIFIGGCQSLEEIFPFLNEAPVIISEPVKSATEDSLYLYQVEASDPDGDVLSYFLDLCPEGMSISSENGLISWLPTNNQVGIHRVVVEISDGRKSTPQDFEIEVSNTNGSPKILSYFPANINVNINEGDSIRFEIQAEDVDFNTTLNYKWYLNGSLVSNSSVTSASGSIFLNNWTYSADVGNSGQKTVKVIISDGALSDDVQWKINVNDVTPPSKPTFDAVTSPTNISSQILSGTKESNSTICINGAEAVALNSSTNWLFSFNLSEGINDISIISRDTAGNESSAVTADIVLDSIAPGVPTLNEVIDPTDISPQILSGSKDANSSILINNTEVVSINSFKDWSYSYNLYEGVNDISITSRDTAGNESTAVITNITLDTSAPATLTLNAVTSPTNISSQVLSGTKEFNSSIWINGTETVTLNSNTTWSFSYNLSEGKNDISITSRDTVGNESSAVTADIFLDSIAPGVPTLNEVISPTNISPQTLSGSKEANSSICINGTEAVAINSNTTWSFSYNLSEGKNDISITSRDTAGNESTAVITNITLDTSAPATLTLDAVTSPTNIAPQILSGTKESNSSTCINGTEAVAINSNTTWSFSYNLSEGKNDISITSRDTAGNESSAVTANIFLDSIAPGVPTLNEVISPTNISPQTLSGSKDANSSIWINGVEAVSIDLETTWLYSFDLSEGINNISITSRDNLDNESSAITSTIKYDLDVYVDAKNISGIENGTETYPFNTITEGIEAAVSGKSVIVAAEIYNEQLVINKGITLQGESKNNTFITGTGFTGNLITITADNVTISGFSIDGKSNTFIGIYSDSYSSIEISENIIQNHRGSGIFYQRTNGDFISGIYIYNNEVSFNLKNGIKIMGTGTGIIESNTIKKNTNGIEACNSVSLEVKKNIINNNIAIGILCQENSSLLIWGNEITFNIYGIEVGMLSSDTTNPDIGGGIKNGVGQNKISGNSANGISNKTTHNIYAKNNWWGDADGPKYPGDFSSSGDWIYWSETGGNIIFEPYLDTEP